MDISAIIKNTLDAADICPAQDIAVNGVVDADWDGVPRILISEEQTVPQDEMQTGTLSNLTSVRIFVLAKNRNEAINLLKQATDAVNAELQTQALNTRQSGIYAADYGVYEVRNIPDRTEFEASRSFTILHK